MNLMTVDRLGVSFEGRPVFENLSFSVEAGNYLCIIGENGSGKTTLMRCLLGLCRHDSGSISCNGFSRREIGWLPQRVDVKRDFPASVFEIVLSGFAGKRFLGWFYSAAQKRLALEKMTLLEIESLKDRAFSTLSGGQQQRVLLCRALCAAERVLLLDEPVTGLDGAAQEEFYGLIRRLHESGITVIMITHDTARSLAEATHVLHIADRGYFFGTADEYREHLRQSGQEDNP